MSAVGSQEPLRIEQNQYCLKKKNNFPHTFWSQNPPLKNLHCVFLIGSQTASFHLCKQRKTHFRVSSFKVIQISFCCCCSDLVDCICLVVSGSSNILTMGSVSDWCCFSWVTTVLLFSLRATTQPLSLHKVQAQLNDVWAIISMKIHWVPYSGGSPCPGTGSCRHPWRSPPCLCR